MNEEIKKLKRGLFLRRTKRTAITILFISAVYYYINPEKFYGNWFNRLSDILIVGTLLFAFYCIVMEIYLDLSHTDTKETEKLIRQEEQREKERREKATNKKPNPHICLAKENSSYVNPYVLRKPGKNHEKVKHIENPVERYYAEKELDAQDEYDQMVIEHYLRNKKSPINSDKD